MAPTQHPMTTLSTELFWRRPRAFTMSKYGRIKRLRLVRHIVTGASRGYAFVEFESDKDMSYAYEMAHQSIIDGSQILVDYNRQQLMPGWIPRRLGTELADWGVVWAAQESGQLRFGGRDRPFRVPLMPQAHITLPGLENTPLCSRTIPQEQLLKLGIPLPPVDQCMSRFQLPPVPRRPGRLKQSSHHRRKSTHEKDQLQYTLPSEKQIVNDEVEMNQQSDVSRASSTSLRQGRRSTDTEEAFSTHKKHRSRHGREEKSGGRDHQEHRHDNERKHKRSHTKQEDPHERSTQPGHLERESARHLDRPASRSDHENREVSHRHRRKERRERERTAHYDRSPEYGYDESR